MIQKRRALLAAFIVGSGAPPAGAGCFDWLFCKTPAVTTPVLPYSAGFAPQTTVTPLGPPVPVGQPVWTAPGPYSANFGGINPASALQMPAYGAMPQTINNPSVLTGMPVNPALTNQAFASPAFANPAFANPWGTTQAGAFAAPQTSFNAAAAFQSQTPMPTNSAPIHSAPINTMSQPAFAPPPASSGGLFGKVFGNGYQTSYNEVPTTVYRPVQQIDPATGQMVIVQQPCTTSVQQVQRSPYTSLQPAPAPAPQQQPYYGEPNCGGEQAHYQSPNQYAPQGQYAPQAQYAPQGQYAPSAGYPAPVTGGGAVGSGVAQTSGVEPYYGSQGYGTQGGYPTSGYAAPIPSTAPSASPPSTTPLQGYPNGYQNGYEQPSDRSNVEQPSLGAASAESFGKPPLTAPPLVNSPNAAPPFSTPSTSTSTPSTNASSRYSDLPPIPAADEYNPPAWGGFNASQPSAPQTPQPKISAPSWNDRTASRVVEPRSTDTQARYASGTTPRSQPAPLPPRDDNGWFAIGQ